MTKGIVNVVKCKGDTHVFPRLKRCTRGRATTTTTTIITGRIINNYKLTLKLKVKGLLITTPCRELYEQPVNIQ